MAIQLSTQMTSIDSVKLWIARYAESLSLPFQVAVKLFAEIKDFGGPGSGHFEHAGRPGLVGGSLPGGAQSIAGIQSQKPQLSTPKSSHYSVKQINEALWKANRIDSPQTLTQDDKDILQLVHPDVHGKPGDPFTYHISLKGPPTPTQLSRNDIVEALTTASMKTLNDISPEAKLVLQNGFPDVYGVPGSSDVHPTPPEGSYDEDVIDAQDLLSETAQKIANNEELSPFDNIVLQELREGLPDIYGLPEEIMFQGKTIETLSPFERYGFASKILGPTATPSWINSLYERADRNEYPNFSIAEKRGLQLVMPWVFGRLGSPFRKDLRPFSDNTVFPNSIIDPINFKIARFSEVHRLSLEDGAKSVMSSHV